MARRPRKARSTSGKSCFGSITFTVRGAGVVATPEGEFYIKRKHLNGAMPDDYVEVKRWNAQANAKKSPPHGAKQQELRKGGRVVRVVERAHTTLLGIYHALDGLGVVIPIDTRLNFDVFIPAAAKVVAAADNDVVQVRIVSYPTRNEVCTGFIESNLGSSEAVGMDVALVVQRYGLFAEFSAAAMSECAQLAEVLDKALSEAAGPNTGGSRAAEQEVGGPKAAASKAEAPNAAAQPRRDLRNELIFTIDPHDAKDFDDALSITVAHGTYRLGVHIADVSAFVPWESALDAEARARTTSVYLPGKVLPMLPEQLSNELCSLGPGCERLTFTVELLFDAAGHCLESHFYPSLIKSAARFTYEQALALLEGAPWNATMGEQPCVSAVELIARLTQLDELAQLLFNNRRARGALDFDSSEVKLCVGSSGAIEQIELREKTRATSLVEEAMIAANEAVASFMLEHEAPLVYRMHEPPLAAELDALLPALKRLGLTVPESNLSSNLIAEILANSKEAGCYDLVSSQLLRIMKRARYHSKLTTHFGLASEAYTHFTSPIRRYPDVLAHRLLKSALGLEPAPASMRAQLQQLCVICSDGEYNADRATAEAVRIKLCEWFAQRRGACFAAKISGVTAHGVFVREDSTRAEGFVPERYFDEDYFYDEDFESWSTLNERRCLSLGARVRVRLTNVDQQRQQLEFALEFTPDPA